MTSATAPGVLYAPSADGECCRACTGRGHRESRIHGKTYLITCTDCEGCGTTVSISLTADRRTA